MDFRAETIYFLLTTRFYDGDPANNFYCRDRIAFDSSGRPTDPHWRGDFKGLIEQLDYLKDLGFTAIWITPPIENRSGLDYHGYHGYDWTRIDPRLESPDATYQHLIDAAHERGIKIIQERRRQPFLPVRDPGQGLDRPPAHQVLRSAGVPAGCGEPRALSG